MKAVLFVAENLYGPRFWVPFFTKLKAETGVKVYCLAPSFAHVNDYSKHDVVDGIFAIDDVLASYGDFEAEFDDEAADLAREFEQRYSANLIDVIQGDRHLGRGMYYLGHHHPKSRNSRLATFGRSIRYIHRLSERLDEFCIEHDIGTFITSGVGADFTKIMCIIARTRGIDIRVLFSARLGQHFTWYHNEFFAHPALAQHFEKMRSAGIVANEYDGATRQNQANAKVRDKSIRHKRLGVAIEQSIKAVINEVRYLLVHNIKYRDKPKFNRYLLLDRIRHLFLIPRQWKDLNRRVTPLDKLKNHRYVFYALQVEPETSTTVHAPEFNNQIAIIDLISKSLPADVLFVIKEHIPGVGRRPSDFYEWLSQIPNVRLAPPAGDGATMARGAAAVIVLTGSLGVEAASDGVPVVAFGRHNAYNVISHVHLVENLFSVRALLQELLGADRKDREHVRAQNRNEGQLFLQALREASFDIGDDVLYHGDPTIPVRAETAEGLVSLFIDYSSHLTANSDTQSKKGTMAAVRP